MSVTSEVDRVRSVYGRRLPEMADRWDPLLPDQALIDAARRRVWGEQLTKLGRRVGRFLEVGCGSGGLVRWSLDVGAGLAVGVDLLPDAVAVAARRDPVGNYAVADGRRLPLRSGAFDTVLFSTVFSSILDDGIAAAVAAEARRVLSPDGVVLWFDFTRSNPANPDVRGVSTGDVVRMFPGYRACVERVVLAPPIARRLQRHSRVLAALEHVRPLRTHLAGVLVSEAAP